MSRSRNKKLTVILFTLAALLVGYCLLLIPESAAPIETAVNKPVLSEAFAWKQDAFWHKLESEFLANRSQGCMQTQQKIDACLVRLKKNLQYLTDGLVAADDPVLHDVEILIFQLAPCIAACPSQLAAFSNLVAEIRLQVKRQSLHWDLTELQTRTRLYRLLYGGRAAVEEVLLQAPRQDSLPALALGREEPSRTPWASILGVKIHSGDILLSRGGAATSALIARGNDFAGNFSHIALVYVHPKTHLASIIESHIERGITISTLEDYLRDVKLRVMVLRLRADLPQVMANPLLPHQAAERALTRAQREHIPYDFTMDFGDTSKLFCSEVASYAYRSHGVNLWMSLSQISSSGLRRWLAGFGVRHFITQEPSDLEYDPQLQIVAEWRDLETLRKDHMDNAVTEVMLDGANLGEPLRYDHWFLPIARVIKAYSFVLNCFGKIGPVPEGMSATAGLRNQWYTRRHAAIKVRVFEEAKRFEQERGYPPPYWRLVEIAGQAKKLFE